MKWKFLKAPLIAFLATSGMLIESLFTRLDSPLGLAIVFFILFIVVLLADYIRKKYVTNIKDVLCRIINSCACDALKITSIVQFVTETKEADLVNGDEVHVLTNSLQDYDTTPPAIKVIANNLKDGVKYVYYLDKDEWPTLSVQKDNLVNLILKEVPNLPRSVVESNLLFYVIDGDCLYNFAIVKSGGTMIGYWYITTPSHLEKVNNLAILTLSQDLGDQLIKVFAILSKSRKVSAMKTGLA